MGAVNFCAHFCCILAFIGIFVYMILIIQIQQDNEYLLAVNHKREARNALFMAAVLNVCLIIVCTIFILKKEKQGPEGSDRNSRQDIIGKFPRSDIYVIEDEDDDILPNNYGNLKQRIL